MSFNLPKWMVGGGPINKWAMKQLGIEDLSLSRQLQTPPEEDEDPAAPVSAPTKSLELPRQPSALRKDRLATMFMRRQSGGAQSGASALGSYWRRMP